MTKIGDYAFYDYEELEDIQFGNTIKEVDFGPDVITLPARAFYNNGSVETVKAIDTGIHDIHMGDANASDNLSGSRRGIFDLEGRKLAKEPARGIYIKDGKKVVR